MAHGFATTNVTIYLTFNNVFPFIWLNGGAAYAQWSPWPNIKNDTHPMDRWPWLELKFERGTSWTKNPNNSTDLSTRKSKSQYILSLIYAAESPTIA